ncbi:uncharacterized protein [Nicotiana sylvestris]|uniref:uncharacterized protein n=1 Tax=Nicotiana sylvestris TaxID=4096 RepID=UPI00388C5A73
MRPPPRGEEEISKPPKEKKKKRESPVNTPKRKKSTVLKPKVDTVALSLETAQRLRDQEEEEYNDCLLVAHEKRSSDASKAAKPVVAETAIVLHKKAFFKSRAELAQYKAELKKISEERVLAEGRVGRATSGGAKAEGGRDLGVELASLKHQFQKVKEEILDQGRKIEELKAKSAAELAKAKSNAEAKALEEEAVALLSNDEDSSSGSDSGVDEEEDPKDEALEGAAPGDAAAEDAAPE